MDDRDGYGYRFRNRRERENCPYREFDQAYYVIDANQDYGKTNLGANGLTSLFQTVDSFLDDASILIVVVAIAIMIGYMSSK